MKQLITIVCLLLATIVLAQQTEKMYLSGTGLNDTKTWEFYCSGGRQSGKWTSIKVPSQWEQQGFGDYTYGRYYLDKTAKPSNEMGQYKYSFKVPSDWKNKEVLIVFEGAMTDTEVKINGELVGEMHQGGFVEFSYDITSFITAGKENVLEVKVWKESANKSITKAERKADWWLFGGIYRPVYLKAVPKTHIERIAVNPAADGKLMTELHLANITDGYSLATSITPLGEDKAVGRQTTELSTEAVQNINTTWDNIKTWNPEHPNLYVLKLELLNSKGKLVHVYEERIGFRTVEFRHKDGIYVNGVKVLMKGVNRHSFDADGGRTTSKEISITDAKLIKEMNMNAVRSHYPPDNHFLDVCDSLGLFYLNELPGWHDRYDSKVGAKILEEMMVRDVNHPSIFMWCNGNEGGWNKDLDAKFADYDPQKRHVIHPWADFNGLDSHHYPEYQTGTYRLANGYNVFMPTEFLHGQYDKGHGSGLEDFWASYCDNPLFAGGFLWAFIDEAVARTDRDGKLDSSGPEGPDGILGPRREKEGSFYTIREVWSPIQITNKYITTSFDGTFFVSNDYLYTNLEACTMKYRVYSIGSPLTEATKKEVASGDVQLPAINPGERGTARFNLPTNFFEGDVLELEAFDKDGNPICNWTWTIKYTSEYYAEQTSKLKSSGKATIEEEGDQIKLSANKVVASFDKATGMLEEVSNDKAVTGFGNGPIPVGMKIAFKEYVTRMDGDDALLVVKYTGAIDSIVWRMQGDGVLGMDALMLNRGNGGKFDGKFYDDLVYNFGISFDYPEEQTTGMQWMGRGPYRVWKNRIPGTNYGLWQKDYNNTITGESFENLVYPEFKGYHANTYWAMLQSDKAPLTVYSESDGLYLRVFTPEEPHNRRKGEDTYFGFPEGDISFLFDIPAMRSFKPISGHGPLSQPSKIRIKSGDEGFRMKLWFDFRKE